MLVCPREKECVRTDDGATCTVDFSVGNGATNATVFVVGGVEAGPQPTSMPSSSALRLSNLPGNAARAVGFQLRAQLGLVETPIVRAAADGSGLARFHNPADFALAAAAVR